ncbi:MAG: ABC transporter ATP-binding protein [bacterium]|nr:ABC transporter ATP-binding protein [bacterium]
MDTAPLLEVRGVTKAYGTSTDAAPVLKSVDLRLESGESVSIVGPSGCGKSTLLNLVGALDRASAGSILFDGQNLSSLSPVELAQFRNRHIGFVFQFHHLLPQCSVLENVLVPTLVNPDKTDARDRAFRLLDRVGLSERLDYRPGQLSGGERQRAAVVRALINRPRLLLADEPTGSLNEEGADALARLLLELNREEDLALLVVTHSTAVAHLMDRTLALHDGALTSHESGA